VSRVCPLVHVRFFGPQAGSQGGSVISFTHTKTRSCNVYTVCGTTGEEAPGLPVVTKSRIASLLNVQRASDRDAESETDSSWCC
jgi:hypothetical protein